jgi:transcriptional regulator with PAS, ATPase and Fis domain
MQRFWLGGRNMINVLFVVPYPKLKEIVTGVVNNHKEKERLNTTIVTATVDKVPLIDIDRYDVIISRGYTAKKTIQQCESIPTVELVISGYDIIRALQESKKRFNPRKVGFCGFYGALSGAREFGEIVGCDVEVYTPSEYHELQNVIDQAKKEGCETIIGGYSAKLYAEKIGLNAIVIKTGEEAVLQSLNEAIRTVDLYRAERIKAEMYRMITKSSKDGVLYVDREGVIRIDNKAVQAMAGRNTLCYHSLDEVFHQLKSSFDQVIRRGVELSHEIYRLKSNTIVSVSFLPVSIGDEVSGVVINLVDITRVQELEGQIRRKLSEKGLRAKYTFDDVVHKSEIMKSTIQMSKLYAHSASNIIIVGETGTGKEIFAQSIHNASLRKDGPFVAVNCAALPENLLESELFGYVEGAFTGTSKGGKIGLFEQAHRGTLFLDEISEVNLSLQSKLLRVLQEQEIRRVGDDKVTSVDVRVITATNKSLKSLVEKGEFRKDLLYRLDILRIFLPPLRNREKDVEDLFLFLMKKIAEKNGKQIPRIENSALNALHGYRFEGNIRELTNVVERVCVLNQGDSINEDTINQVLYPEDIESDEQSESMGKSIHLVKRDSEIETIRWAMKESNGNQTKASKLLGIDRSTLWRKLRKYSLDESENS